MVYICRQFFEVQSVKPFLHLHLPHYKHSLSTRLICSDSVRFVKVLNVSAHRPHSQKH